MFIVSILRFSSTTSEGQARTHSVEDRRLLWQALIIAVLLQLCNIACFVSEIVDHGTLVCFENSIFFKCHQLHSRSAIFLTLLPWSSLSLTTLRIRQYSFSQIPRYEISCLDLLCYREFDAKPDSHDSIRTRKNMLMKILHNSYSLDDANCRIIWKL